MDKHPGLMFIGEYIGKDEIELEKEVIEDLLGKLGLIDGEAFYRCLA